MDTWLARLGIAGLLAAAATSHGQGSTPDFDAIAARVVEGSARVAEGEVVLIRGHVRDQEFLEDIAIRVRALGAFPILSYSSDHLATGLMDQVPERFDNQLNALDVKLVPSLSAVITVDSTDNPSLLNHIPTPRLAVRAKADAAYSELLRRLGVRQVIIGNGLYPTNATANQYAMSAAELAKVFWKAMDADASGMRATGEMARYVLASGKELHLTNPNGTDLKVKIDAKPVRISDGLAPDPDEKQPVRGGPPVIALPAGELLLVPAMNTAEGKLVVDSLTYRGRDVTGLTLTFKAGKVVNFYGKGGMDAIKPLYDAAGQGKDVLSYLSLGLNPSVLLPAGIKANAPMPQGMVSMNIGNNARAGGENGGAFELLLSLPGSTLSVDETVLVESGKLVMPVSKDVVEPTEPAPAETTPEGGH